MSPKLTSTPPLFPSPFRFFVPLWFKFLFVAGVLGDWPPTLILTSIPKPSSIFSLSPIGFSDGGRSR